MYVSKTKLFSPFYFPLAPEHEIVYPLVVQSDSKRSVGSGPIAASSLELEVDAFGEKLILSVDHDDSNYAPGLQAEIYTDEGIQKVPVRTDCIYTGKVAGEKDSIASVTTCAGLVSLVFICHKRNDATEPARRQAFLHGYCVTAMYI